MQPAEKIDDSSYQLPHDRSLIGSMALAMLVLDPAMMIASINPAGETLLGQSAKRLLGRPLLETLEFQDHRIPAKLAEGDCQIAAHGIAIRLRGQAPRAFDLTIAPVGQQAGWQVMTLCDAADTQDQLADERAGEQTIALRAPEILAHEIKNPLAGIRGAAQLLARQLGEKGQALTTLITAEVDRIASLMDEMQSLSRKTVSPGESANLHELLGRARDILAAAQTAPLAMREEFDPSIPLIHCHGDSLVQVLINLIKNAQEACHGVDNPQIILTTRFSSGIMVHQPDGVRPIQLPVELRISDNGPGFDPSVAGHLFEPFVTSKKQGQGLGLALVRKLVREMNGRITCERDEAAGWTHFRLFLPVANKASQL